MVKVKEDLTGWKFDRLTVIKQVEDYIDPHGKHSSQWLCKCDCGGEIIVTSSNLKSKSIKSCGCLRKEKAAKITKKAKKYNIYDLTNGYGIGYLDDGKQFYFDLEDYNKIKDIKWKEDKDGYIVSNMYNKDTGKTIGIKMHRLIMSCPDNMYVDHIENNKKNDNRKHNLRICTLQENNMHRKKAKNNTSGVTGVYWHSGVEKWVAVIYYKNKRIELGRYNNFEEAKRVRQKKEKELFGEFAYNDI